MALQASDCHASIPKMARPHLKIPFPSSSLHALLRSPSIIFSYYLWPMIFLLVAPPSLVEADVFRLGVVGPWSCDPMFAMALPARAAKLAVDRLSCDESFAPNTTFEYVMLDEGCQTSRALEGFMGFDDKATGFIGPVNPGYCEAASMLGKGWNKPLFSWACEGYELDEVRSLHPTFARSMTRPTWVLLSLMKHFHWNQVAVIASGEDSWVETAIKVSSTLRRYGIPVRLTSAVGNDHMTVRKILSRVRKLQELRVVILCMHSALLGGETQKRLLETALDMGLTDGRLVFLPYDTMMYSLPYRHHSYPALQTNGKLLQAYDAVLTITVESLVYRSFQDAFQRAVDSGELRTNKKPEQVSPLFGTIYTSVLFMAYAVRKARLAGDWLTGANVARYTRNLDFEGFSHPIRTHEDGGGLTDFLVLDMDGIDPELRPTHRIEMESNMVVSLGRDIHFPDGGGPDTSCWFGITFICITAMALIKAMVAFLVILLILAIIYAIRRKVKELHSLQGHHKMVLTLNDVIFISRSLSTQMLSFDDSRLRQASEGRLSTRSPPNIENSNVIVFEGDWAWLKKFRTANFQTLNHRIKDVAELMKDMRQENINPFLGLFFDGGVFATVWEFCNRGSLEDLLLNGDVKLDWMFKSSLLLDLIKGIKYLHHRGMVHGRLKSRNCVVDGRFVLKITDYGYRGVVEAHNIPYEEQQPEDLLWTAPELLRGPTPGLKSSFQGDSYAFAIITQEVVLRAPPFCMYELSASDIVQKVRGNPSPLCRPQVTADYAPVECLALINRCWQEQAEKRPNFDEIFDQFKNINKGRKTNIIDSMLRMLEQYSSNLEELIRERTEELEVEKHKTEKLLTQMLPPTVADVLKRGGAVRPEHFDAVSLYFSDIVGFTTISANSEPIEVVDLLNDLYTCFDAIIGNHDVYKVETIGDAYMVASGVPVPNGDRHAGEITNMALDIMSAIGTFKMRHMPDVPVRIRIGLHSGPCVAGVVGLTMPRYCLFGDTVTTASKMESSGVPYRIHVSQIIVNLLRGLNEGYQILERERPPENKDDEPTYFITGRDGFDKPLPVPPELKPGQGAHGIQLAEIAKSKKKRKEEKEKWEASQKSLNVADVAKEMMLQSQKSFNLGEIKEKEKEPRRCYRALWERGVMLAEVAEKKKKQREMRSQKSFNLSEVKKLE